MCIRFELCFSVFGMQFTRWEEDGCVYYFGNTGEIFGYGKLKAYVFFLFCFINQCLCGYTFFHCNSPLQTAFLFDYMLPQIYLCQRASFINKSGSMCNESPATVCFILLFVYLQYCTNDVFQQLWRIEKNYFHF